MNKLVQRVTALEGKQQPRSYPARGAACLQSNMDSASACAASRTQNSVDGGQNHRTKRRPNKFGRHTQSNVMAAAPTDKVNVGAAIARAGSVLAASSHALQEWRSPSVGPSSFSILDLLDNDNKLPDDICYDNEVCVENLHSNAVVTRAQRSVHFAPIIREHPFDAAAPLAAVANRAADPQRPLKVKPKPSPPSRRTVHPKALPDPARLPASPDVTADLQDPPAAVADAVLTPNSSSRSRKQQRGRLRADSGDVCGESDSPHITLHRESAQAVLRRQHAASRVSDRVVQALLRSPLTLQLTDLVELVTQSDQTD
jgi:hypothetical protein